MRLWKRCAWLLALVVPLLGLASQPASCRPEVVVGGRVVMRFGSDGKASADKRAAAVQKKLDGLLRKRLPASKIAVGSRRGLFTLSWSGQVFCTVDAVQAKENGCSPRELASRWAHNLKEAVEAGFLRVSPGSLAVPVGENRKLCVEGIARGPIGLAVDSNRLQASSTPDGSVAVMGMAAGRFRLTVTREGAKVVVPVVVKEYAGSVPDRTTFTVSGQPADRQLLREAAVQATRAAVQARPGASVTLREIGPIPLALEGGRETVVRLSLDIEGEEYFPVSRSIDVTLRNELVTLKPPSLLMVSNRPEKIEHEGILWKSTFRRDQATRLLYSHLNGARGDMHLWVTLVNRSERAARVLVIQADGGPATQELFVGHRCNTRFLEDIARRQGFIVVIPPGKAWELGRYKMGSRELVSGLCHLQMLEGDELEATVETSPQGVRIGQVMNQVESPFNPFMIHPHGVFVDPNITLDEKFVVGTSESTEIPFGRAPWLIDPQSGEPNTGNYGVLYEMRLELSNPTALPQRVSLFFEPVNGVALGSFLVEGKLTETSCLKPPARALIGTVDLLPQQNRSVRIITLPQAGSHYPARIVIRSTVQESHRASGGI